MTTLDNPKFFSIITDYIMSRSSEPNIILMLMNLRCNKTMRRKIEMLLTIVLSESSIDVTSLTKKHRRLYRSNHSVTARYVEWRIDPFNDINPLIIETSRLRRRRGIMDITLTTIIDVDEEDDKRIIIASIYNQCDDKTNGEYNLTLTKITEDMYHQVKLTYAHGRERTTNGYIHNINGMIITVIGYSGIVTIYYGGYEARYYMEDGILIKEYDSDEEGQEPMISMNEAARRTFNYIESQ